VLGPLAGVAASTWGGVVALTDGDWVSTMILGAIASMLALAGFRNWRALRKSE
jgi:hypothetical protein